MAKDDEAAHVLPVLTTRLQSLMAADEKAHEVDADAPAGDDDDDGDMGDLRTPFEFLAVEAFMQVVIEHLSARLDALADDVAASLVPLKTGVAKATQVRARLPCAAVGGEGSHLPPQCVCVCACVHGHARVSLASSCLWWRS